MITRSKLVAATLGLVVATVAMGDAMAATTVKSTVKSAAVKTTARKPLVRAAHEAPGIRVGAAAARHAPLVAHVRRLFRTPSQVTVVKAVAPRTPVHVVKRPLLQKQAMVHRLIVRKTIIR